MKSNYATTANRTTFTHGTTTGFGMLNGDGAGSTNYVNAITEELKPPIINYKYAEGQIISDFHKYIDKTYTQHYQTDEERLQCFDAWIALGEATPTFRNTAMKYLWRYGKKNGNNKDDLMKVLHYTLMCLYNDHYKK